MDSNLNHPLSENEPHLPTRRVDPRSQRTRMAHSRNGSKKGSATPAPQQFSPKFLLWVFSRSWKVAIPVGVVLAAGVAAGLLHTYVPLYTASGIIQIEDNQTYIAFPNGAEVSQSNKFVRTQIELMRSSVVLREALGDDRVGSAQHLVGKADRIAVIQGNLEVRQVGGSELYEVSYDSPSPQESSDVVAAVIKQYFARQSDQGYRRVQRVIDLLEKERARRQLEVERLQRHVVNLSREVTGKDPFGDNRVTDVEKAISPLASLHQQLSDVEVRIEILRAELQSMEETEVVAVDHAESTKLIDMEVEMHADVKGREQAIEEVKAQMRIRHRSLVPTELKRDRMYRDLAETLQKLRKELAEFKPMLKKRLLAAHKAGRGAGGYSEAEIKRRELAGLEVQQTALQRRFDQELKNVQDGGGKGAELEFAKAELAREEKVFEMIAARKLALQTESKAPARVEVVAEVTASQAPIESAPWKKLFMACTLAMAAPFGVAVLREISLRRVTDAEQLFEDTSLRILGEIAAFPARRLAANPRQLPKKLRKEMYAFVESIDALRMSLMFAAPEEQQRVVAITSAVSGEGKSSVSAALAMSFANATKKRTLLLDGDMRDPSVQDLVDSPDGPGLSEVLSGKCTLDEAIRPAEGASNLYVLRAGSCQGSPHHLAQPQRLLKLVEALRGNFNTIVIDTPPVLGASEALSLCRAADMTAVCTRRGVSRVKQVKLAMDKLDSVGAEVAGSILSGVPTRGYGYAYAYGYGFQEQVDQIDHTPLS